MYKVDKLIFSINEEARHTFNNNEEFVDELFDVIVKFGISNKKISSTLISKQFKVGYARACRSYERLENLGFLYKDPKKHVNSLKQVDINKATLYLKNKYYA